MLPKEIMTILEKYQDNNTKELLSINQYITNIVQELKFINTSLSKLMIALVNSNSVDSKEVELLKDSQVLRNYINSVTCLNIDTSLQFNNQLQKLFNDGVRPFLVSNDICPECNRELIPFTIHYCRKHDDQIVEESVEWSRCPICKRWFVLDIWLSDFDLVNTNITLNRKYYDTIPAVGIYSVIVLSNTLRCSLNHKTKDILAILPVINEQGNLSHVKVNASYCFECNRFTILREDFNSIKDVVICKIIDETIEIAYGHREDVEFEQRNSVLFNYGYNVQTKANLSDKQRQTILSSVIEAGIMNKRDIINHITTLIDRGSKISSWKLATHKWKQDRDFVSKYQNGSLPEVIFNEIILKHKKI